MRVSIAAFWSAVSLPVCLLIAGNLFGQSSNASVGGFVQDPSQAFIPGVTVTATNTQTGIVSSTVTNESGTYTISSLLSGTYKLTAELPGFKTQIINDVQLGQGTVARYNPATTLWVPFPTVLNGEHRVELHGQQGRNQNHTLKHVARPQDVK